MYKILEAIAKEFNPLHDFDRFRFYGMGDVYIEKDQSKRIERIASNGKFLLWTPKVMVRGILVGACMGGLAGILSDDLQSYDELYRGLAVGGSLGFQIDIMQYWIRGAFHLFSR